VGYCTFIKMILDPKLHITDAWILYTTDKNEVAYTLSFHCALYADDLE